MSFIRNSLKYRTEMLKIKGCTKRCQANVNKKEAGMTIFTSNRVELKVKSCKQNKEEHCVIIKYNL
jgi:hypothetical protein